MMIKMGQIVEEVFRRYESEHEGCSVTWFAEQLHCDRRNVYDIFKRYTIGDYEEALTLFKRVSSTMPEAAQAAKEIQDIINLRVD